MLCVVLLFIAVSEPPSDLAALGVVTSVDPSRSAAILCSSGRCRAVKMGEAAFGGRLTGVGSHDVTLEFGGSSIHVPLRGGANATTPANQVAQREPQHTLSREQFERRLASEMPRILSDTAVSAVNVGAVKGVTLSRVAQGTVLTDAGLQQGDVITEVDGVAVGSPMDLLGLYPLLKTQSRFQAVVLRNGQPVTLTLSLQ